MGRGNHVWFVSRKELLQSCLCFLGVSRGVGFPAVQGPIPLREQPQDLPLPEQVHVGPCQPRLWGQFEIKLSFFVWPHSPGPSGPAPLLQTSLFLHSAKEGTLLWLMRPLVTRIVSSLSEGEEARGSWLSADLNRKEMDLCKGDPKNPEFILYKIMSLFSQV